MTDKDSAAGRDARLKAALRDNLKRRKQAARRGRDDPSRKPGEKDAGTDT